jgi:tetratricopeptide (TPR) repeat protein
MFAASLSPADFAPPVGYLGPPESTPYYPTGDLRGDRSIAFTTAMNCLEDLEVSHQGNDAQIAAKLFELAQALSDLGLRESALDTCGYASESLDRLYIAEPSKYRLRVASVLSLRANILCDLKRNDEARDAADRAVTLCKEHKGSQAGPVPQLAYALLNYAVLLCSIGLKDESAAVAFELLCEDDMGPEMENIFALCKLCISTTRIGIDDDTGMEMAEETIELSRMSSDANTQTMLAGALLAKAKILSSTGQNDAAPAISAEAVTVLRSMSAPRPVFSLFLAHALDTHAHHLSEANRKGESYATRHDAVEHWQTLKVTAGDAVARPLAYSLFHLANFRSTDEGKNARREELQLAESAVDMFRQVVPLDAPGLGDALYHVATRMLDLDDNREAATYAEESIQYFRDASAEDPKYERDLILSLSLASSCLACTERGYDAFEYAKQAVELHHERKVEKDEQYNFLLHKLLMDAMVRAGEIDRHAEALPYFQELQAIGGLGGMPRVSLFDQLVMCLTTDF